MIHSVTAVLIKVEMLVLLHLYQNSTPSHKQNKVDQSKKAVPELWAIWKDNNGDISGFLSMLSISSTVIKKIIKTLGKQGLDTDVLTEQVIKESHYAQFGVHKE